MITKKLLEKEVYAIAVPPTTLIYAPLTRYFILYEGTASLADVESEWLQEATDLKNIPQFVRNKGFALDHKKIRLRLNITTGCNLLCGYCSVNAGGVGEKMPEDVAAFAIKSFSRLAKSQKTEEIELSFSGGEPTLRISFIEKMIGLAKKELSNSAIKLSSRLITNGIFSATEFSRIMGLLREVQISWDGPADKTPRYSHNEELAEKAWDNIAFLLSQNIPVSVLTVVSSDNYLHLNEIICSLYALGIRKFFLAPEDEVGRSYRRGEIDYKKLGDIYFNLWKFYRKKNIEINLAGTDIHSLSPFPCAVSAPNYSIAPNGTISACTITFNDQSKFANSFMIGSVKTGELCLNTKAINRMKGLHVLNMKGCRNCFAKWHCKGGCMYAKRNNQLGTLLLEHCEMIKTVVKKKLLETVSEE